MYILLFFCDCVDLIPERKYISYLPYPPTDPVVPQGPTLKNDHITYISFFSFSLNFTFGILNLNTLLKLCTRSLFISRPLFQAPRSAIESIKSPMLTRRTRKIITRRRMHFSRCLWSSYKSSTANEGLYEDTTIDNPDDLWDTPDEYSYFDFEVFLSYKLSVTVNRARLLLWSWSTNRSKRA